MIHSLFFLGILTANTDLYMKRFGLNTTVENITSSLCQFAFDNFRLGSTYQITLNNCKVGDCHAIIDRSYSLKWGPPGSINPSIFLDVNISGATFLNSSAGIIFRPTSRLVEINLTTQTCHNFFQLHPFETTENCSIIAPFSDVVRGLPLCKNLP